MGVYIKGMKMPTSCQECVFRVDESETNVHEWICLINQYPTFYCKKSQSHAEDEEYLQDCPLVPVPPHGRLGDLDKLAEYFDSLEKEHPFLRFTPSAVGSILRSECYSPTIIEAEEGE